MSSKSDKHGWNSLENYLAVHESTLDRYISKHYVRGPSKYTVVKLTDQNIQIRLKNLILRTHSASEIEFKIEKTVELDIDYARPRARTFDHSYHAFRPKPLSRNLIRYCSPHDHRPFHHKHLYKDDGSVDVIKIPEGVWPHVSEFFDEVLNAF